MPSSVKNSLNFMNRATATAAEINGGVAPFAAIAVTNATDQVLYMSGVIASVAMVAADANPAHQLFTFLQRNLTPRGAEAWTGILNREEQVLYYQDSVPGQNFSRTLLFTTPVELQAGSSFALVVGLLPGAVFASPADLYVNLLGRQVSSGGKPFPYELR
jgi:hypothetical protein